MQRGVTSLDLPVGSRVRMNGDLLQRFYQARRKLIQLPRMVASESPQNLSALACDLQDRAPFIPRIGQTDEKSFALGPIHKFHGAVVLDPKSRGRIGDRDNCLLRGARHLQQKLMLLGL